MPKSPFLKSIQLKSSVVQILIFYIINISIPTQNAVRFPKQLKRYNQILNSSCSCWSLAFFTVPLTLNSITMLRGSYKYIWFPKLYDFVWICLLNPSGKGDGQYCTKTVFFSPFSKAHACMAHLPTCLSLTSHPLYNPQSARSTCNR